MRRRLAVLAATGLTLALLAPVASASAATAINVRPGQSIQAAVDRASAGGTIDVAPGRYQENLEIVTSNVHLVGDHAVIVPPAVPTDTFCNPEITGFTGTTGICIHGGIDLTTGAITAISNVSIEGITVRDFGGPGIVALGVHGLRLADVVTAHNGDMHRLGRARISAIARGRGARALPGAGRPLGRALRAPLPGGRRAGFLEPLGL